MSWVDPAALGWAAGVVAAGWLAPRRLQTTAMAAVGGLFLIVTDARSAAVLAALGVVGLVLARGAAGKGWRAVAAIVIVAGTIVAFKLGVQLGGPGSAGLVPLGLSYYGLRVVHLVFEASQGRVTRVASAEVCRYLLFLPTMVAGPINRFGDFVRDGRRRRWDRALFALGLERVLYGHVKIVVLANYLVGVKLGAWVEGMAAGDWLPALLGCARYGANLYLQFAGYSDIAIGLALLVGFRVPENFRWPWLATDIHEFWERWHITLSHWCRDYVFRPVASATRLPWVGVVASMLVLGAWHELSWRYILWGLYHGLGLVAWRAWSTRREGRWVAESQWLRGAAAVLSWLATMVFVVLSFGLTSTTSLGQAWSTWVTILTLGRS